MILKRSLIFSLLFFCAGFLFAQEIESVESSSEEINAASDGSVGNEAAEEKSNDREVEISRDIGVSFNIGSIVTYDNERMHDFHSQWFGWYPEFLIFLGTIFTVNGSVGTRNFLFFSDWIYRAEFKT